MTLRDRQRHGAGRCGGAAFPGKSRESTGASGRPGLSGLAPARLLAPCLAAFAVLAAPPALTLSLTLPAGATKSAEDLLPSGVQLPVAPLSGGTIPRAEFTGRVLRQAFALPGTTGTFGLTAPLRAQLERDNWQLLVDCETNACGGFDFRFALAVLPEPAMHVDLGDFRYLAARRGREMVAILASRRGDTGYLQITIASEEPPPGTDQPGAGLSGSDLPGVDGTGPAGDPPPRDRGGVQVTLDPGPGGLYAPGALAPTLDSAGHVALTDLEFATGSAELGAGPYGSLTELAAYLAANPARRVALVGHTDATGSLEINIQVSRRRAQSVLERLVAGHGVQRNQLAAEAVGYLAPLQSNLSEAGRAANRRVEAVLLSTE